MKNICIDFGNTFSKIGYFYNAELIEYYPKTTSNTLYEKCQKLEFDQIMVCSVTKSEAEILIEFEKFQKPIRVLSSATLIPINKNYETPNTLGADRLAAAVGASTLFPSENCLIIDLGTCIKYDLLENGNTFQGGIISPGLRMRFKAMHHFTKKLPLIEEIGPWPQLVGKNTLNALKSGVLNGMLAEINGIIEQYEAQLTKFKIILCGGDASLFESRLKNPTFVVPELVPLGLNKILLHNIENK
jgi:type III pantothenate kinase